MAALVIAALPAGIAAADAGRPGVVQRFTDPRLVESSGLVASPRHRGLLWTVADSDNPAEVYGVRDGRVVAVARLAGVANVDWEALAPGPDDTLWVGDLGDNDRRRSTIALHVIPEPPASGERTVRPRTYDLRYPDGPHDAEALLVDPRDGTVLVVTKALVGAGVYRAPRLRAGRVATLRRIASASPVVTDGGYAPDGRRLALRTYFGAEVYRSPTGEGTPVALPPQPRGESLAWTPDGGALLVGSEGARSAVWRVPLPAALVASPSRSAAAGSRAVPAGTAAAGPLAQVLRLVAWGGGAALLLAVLAGAAARRRSRR